MNLKASYFFLNLLNNFAQPIFSEYLTNFTCHWKYVMTLFVN